MAQATIRCDAVPVPGRRALLLAAAALLPGHRARADGATPLAALVGADGTASPLARGLEAQALSVRGYLSPSLDGRSFGLTEQPPMPCQLCGATHDLGASLAVRTAQPDAGALPVREVAVTGRLELSPTLRLVDARIEAA